MSVYETITYTDHLWLEGGNNATLSWRMTNPTSYTVTIKGMEIPAKLIFSESYDPYWQLDIGGRIRCIFCIADRGIAHSFYLDETPDSPVTIR